MNIHFLFTKVKNEFICKYIYTSENNKVFSYSFDEGYIVKNEESAIRSLKQISDKYSAKAPVKKDGKGSVQPVLIEKEYNDVRQSLYFLNGTLDDFNNGIPARKRLPEIINPYDLDFDESDNFDSMGDGFGEDNSPLDKDDIDDSFDDDSSFDDNIDDEDAYKDTADSFDDDFDQEDDFDDEDDDDYYRK